MRALADALASYVPSRILERLIAGGGCTPFTERFPAALLFADISDSTRLAERLAAQGPAGAEEFSRLLNAYLGAVIDVVTAHGGDVVKFAGDGLFALWPAEEHGGLAAATRHAAQCALAVQETLRLRRPGEVIRLSMRIGVGAGEVIGVAVGSPDDRMEYLIVGGPVMETCRAERVAAAGEVVVTAEAWRTMGAGCVGTPLPADGVRLEALDAPAPPTPMVMPAVSPSAVTALRAFAPPAIVARLSAGQNEWLAELRHVTILFSRLPDWTGLTLDEVQELTSTVLRVMTRYQGTLARLGMDEHGPVAQFAFGLPPLAHEDDPMRGVQAALEMHATLRARGVRCGIGIATGRAFCGAVGGARRREYATVGDAVNVAARLMYAAGNGILCDPTTAAACGDRLTFEPLPAIEVKGKAAPLAVYRPRGRSGAPARPRPDLVGRAAERAQLRRRLHALINAGTGGVVLIEGEAGIGKSRLATDLRAQAQALGVAAFLGSSDAIEMATAYHAWRPVVSQLFEFNALPENRMIWRAHMLAWLDAESAGDDSVPSLLQLAPLLNAVVPLDIPENPLTAQMSDEARADNLHELLVALLQRAARCQPLLLVLEDAHWMDSASWAVTLLASQRVAQLLLVVVTRPPGDAAPVEYRRLVHALGAERLLLDTLSSDETCVLVCQRLGVKSLSAPVAALVQERAGGHPFFTEELAYALRDAGIVTTAGGECHFAVQADVLQQLALPRTLQGMITSRVDRLTPRQQLALKVASVFGRNFSLDKLRDVHPIEADKAHLLSDLSALERLDLIRSDPAASNPTYLFKHAVTQEAVYDLLAFTQRRQLHRAVAEWYERACGSDPSLHATLLAHHWGAAVDPQHPDQSLLAKAIAACERAGERGVLSNANQEAVRFFEDTLRFQAQQDDGADAAERRRRAHLERALGEAYYKLGKSLDAREHLQTALRLMGQRVPSTAGSWAIALLGGVGRQIVRRMSSDHGNRRAHGERRTLLLEAARTYETLALVWFIAGERLASLVGNLRGLNLAEVAGPSPELANSYAMVGLLSGVLLLPRLADSYLGRGRDTAERVGDPFCFARVCYTRGYYHICRGEWREAGTVLTRALEIFDSIGDRRWRDTALLTLGNLSLMQTQARDSLRAFTNVSALTRERGDLQAQAWALIGMIGAQIMLGQLDETVRGLDTLDEWLTHNLGIVTDPASEFSIRGIRAIAHARRGEWQQAVQAAQACAAMLDRAPFFAYHALPGYTNLAEVSLTLWEMSASEPWVDGGMWREHARRVVTALQTFARFYPIGRPQAWLWKGVQWWLAGKRARAAAAWRQSLREAERLHMPFEQALAHFEIGRHLQAAEAPRETHLLQACQLFEQLGTRCHLERARAALRPTTERSPFYGSSEPAAPVTA